MTALIVDDEKHARDRLIEMLKEINFFSKYIEAKSGEMAAGFLLKEAVDVCFFDINMPGISIFDVIKKIKDPPLIIFHTAYSEHAVKAFEIEAFDYLLKPLSMERLKNCIRKIRNRLEPVKTVKADHENKISINKLPCRKEGKINLVEVEKIIKITSIDGLSFAFTGEEKYMLDKYLNYYEKELKSSGFFRINRTDLINLNFIKSIHPMFKGNLSIELKNGDMLEISRRKRNDLKKIYRLS